MILLKGLTEGCSCAARQFVELLDTEEENSMSDVFPSAPACHPATSPEPWRLTSPQRWVSSKSEPRCPGQTCKNPIAGHRPSLASRWHLSVAETNVPIELLSPSIHSAHVRPVHSSTKSTARVVANAGEETHDTQSKTPTLALAYVEPHAGVRRQELYVCIMYVVISFFMHPGEPPAPALRWLFSPAHPESYGFCR
jgi:hypothetical protein